MEGKHKLQSHQDVQEHLICSICQDVYDDPRNLSCGHVFCRKCLEEMPKTHNKNLTVFPCPNCRKDIFMKKTKVNDLPRNIPLRGILDTLNHVNSGRSGRACKKLKISSMCATHPDECVDIFCNTCKIFVCFICNKQKHSDHETHAKNVFLGDMRKTFREGTIKQEKLKANLAEIERERRKMITAVKTWKEEINNDYEEQIKELRLRKESKQKMLQEAVQGWKNKFSQVKKEGAEVTEKMAKALSGLQTDSLEDTQEAVKKCTEQAKVVEEMLSASVMSIKVEPYKAWPGIEPASTESCYSFRSTPSHQQNTLPEEEEEDDDDDNDYNYDSDDD